jgi:hypothetical protein
LQSMERILYGFTTAKAGKFALLGFSKVTKWKSVICFAFLQRNPIWFAPTEFEGENGNNVKKELGF